MNTWTLSDLEESLANKKEHRFNKLKNSPGSPDEYFEFLNEEIQIVEQEVKRRQEAKTVVCASNKRIASRLTLGKEYVVVGFSSAYIATKKSVAPCYVVVCDDGVTRAYDADLFLLPTQ